MVFVIVALAGYFVLPMARVQEHVPKVGGKSSVEWDAYFVPHEKVFLTDRAVLSQVRGATPVPPRYLVCSINDDPDGTNAFGVYDPTDLAVTVSNLVRLNTKHLFLGTHLHWPDLPELENNTLCSQLELLDSCVLSVPLRRTAGSVDVPDYLADSSLALGSLKGDVLSLPRVNQVSLAPTLKIPKNCRVGFSQLESEPETDDIPLLAVWGERVILSSLLLERIHHLGLEPADLDVMVGKFIVLGDTGNVIPINEFGYFRSDVLLEESEVHLISADITSVEDSPVDTENTILTAAGVKADDYRAIESPVVKLNQLTLTPVFEETQKYERIWWWAEAGLALVVVLLLLWFSGKSVLFYWFWSVLVAGLLVAGSMRLCGETLYYAPILYLLFAVVACMLVFPFLRRGVVAVEGEVVGGGGKLGSEGECEVIHRLREGRRGRFRV